MVQLLQNCGQEAGQGFSLSNLAVTLGVDERTVKRYLSDLRKLKFDLLAEKGLQGKMHYRIRTGPNIPLHFIPSLKKIRSELQAGGNPKYSQLISQLMDFLENKEKAQLPAKSDTTSALNAYYIDHGPFAEADPSPGILRLLEEAILTQRQIRLTYTGLGNKAGSKSASDEFRFFPYTLSLRVGTLYLIGRQSSNSGAFKSLSVKRIKRCIASPENFKRESFDAADYYKFCFGQWARQKDEIPETVLFEVKAKWLEKYLSESHFNPPGKWVEKGKDTFYELKLVIKPDFVNWVLSLMPDLVPVKPESLREEVTERLRRSLSQFPHTPSL